MWFLSVGSALIDTVVRNASGYHHAGQEQSCSVGAISEHAGGMALNTACQLRGLDLGEQQPRWASIHLLARYNAGATSSAISSTLKALEIKPLDLGRGRMYVDGRCICVTRHGDTGNADAIRRNFYVHIPPGNQLSDDDIISILDFSDQLDSPGWVHFANLAGEPSYYSSTTINVMRQLRRKKNIKISANTVGIEKGLEALRSNHDFVQQLDWLVVNIREAQTILGDTFDTDSRLNLYDATTATENISKHFELLRGVAVTCGAHGSSARYGNKIAKRAIDRSLLPPRDGLIDPVGCGDAWMAGFIDSLVGECSLDECLVRANKMGTLALGVAGGSEPVCRRSKL